MIQIALGSGMWEINETAQGVETRLNKSAPKIVEAIQLIGFIATICEVNNSPSIFSTDNIGKETILEEALKALCSLNNKRFTHVTLPEDACVVTLSDILKEDQAKIGRCVFFILEEERYLPFQTVHILEGFHSHATRVLSVNLNTFEKYIFQADTKVLVIKMRNSENVH